MLHPSLTCYCSKISNNIAKKSKFQNASSVGRTKRNMMHKIGWIACYSPCIIDFMQRLKAFLKPRGVFLRMIKSIVRQEITERLESSHYCWEYGISYSRDPYKKFVPNNAPIPYFKTGWTKGYLGLAFSNTDIPSGES